MKIYIYGKMTQYCGTELIGANPKKEQAEKWCNDQNYKNEDPTVTFEIKELDLEFNELQTLYRFVKDGTTQSRDHKGAFETMLYRFEKLFPELKQ